MVGRIEDYAIVGDMQSLAGNMPQAFSHVPLVQTALNLSGHAEEHRRGPRAPGIPRDERRSVPG